MKMNRITAKGVSGIYKDEDIEVEIGESSEKCAVKVNGQYVKNILGIHIHMRAGKLTTLVLEKCRGDYKE